MAFFKKKSTAAVICVLLMLFALLFGGGRSLRAAQNKALDAYTAGDSTGLSILANLNSVTEYASTLLKTAGGYYGEQDAVFADVRSAYLRLMDCITGAAPDVQRQALSDLLSACTLLEADFTVRGDIPEDKVRVMRRSINDIISMKDQMRHSEYNTMAADFNQKLEKFPASVLAGMSGVQALPLF